LTKGDHVTRYFILVRLCLNASNIKHGGAIGVAASFLDEVLKKAELGELGWVSDLTLQVSNNVRNEMRFERLISEDDRIKFEVSPAEMKPLVPSLRRKFDVRFSIFGPEYATRKAHVEIAGFADGSLFPPPDATHDLNPIQSAKLGLLRAIKLRQLRRYDCLIVETQAMADMLLRQHSTDAPIWIVPNSPRDVFFDTEFPAPKICLSRTTNNLTLFYPSRGYPHKNHKIIPQVADKYLKLTGSQLKIVTTLRAEELESLGLTGEDSLINVGEIGSEECARLMYACDGVFFPSLNETASSTPLESLAIQRILFASDRNFVRDTMRESAVYFDPLDPTDAANKICEFQGVEKRNNFVANNQSRRDSLPTQAQRAEAYLDVIKSYQP
jgi:hypothetical protein